MPQFDIDEVSKLLQIPSLVASTAPGLTHIAAEAMSRLREINEGLLRAKTRPAIEPPGQPSALPPEPSAPVKPPKSEVAAGPSPPVPSVEAANPVGAAPEPTVLGEPRRI